MAVLNAGLVEPCLPGEGAQDNRACMKEGGTERSGKALPVYLEDVIATLSSQNS